MRPPNRDSVHIAQTNAGKGLLAVETQVTPLVAELTASGLGISSIFQIFNDEVRRATGLVVGRSLRSVNLGLPGSLRFSVAETASDVTLPPSKRKVTDAPRPNAVARSSNVGSHEF